MNAKATNAHGPNGTVTNLSTTENKSAGDYILNKDRAYCREITKDVTCSNGLRVFRLHPNVLDVQVRYHGPTNGKPTGKTRDMIAGVSITRDEAYWLMARLDEFVNEGR